MAGTYVLLDVIEGRGDLWDAWYTHRGQQNSKSMVHHWLPITVGSTWCRRRESNQLGTYWVDQHNVSILRCLG